MHDREDCVVYQEGGPPCPDCVGETKGSHLDSSGVKTVTDIYTAMFNASFPGNPLPFAKGVFELVKEKGTDAIQSDEAKRVLWILMAQAYGTTATINLMDEWTRLLEDWEATSEPSLAHAPEPLEGPGCCPTCLLPMERGHHGCQCTDEQEDQ